MSYALVQIDPFAILAQWEAIPDPVVFPNGNAMHGVTAGAVHDGCKVVSIVHDAGAPNEFYKPTDITPSFDGATLLMTRTWSPIDVAQVKSILGARVDDRAEAERLKYITAGAGQALTYQAKLEEAKAFLAASSPDPDDYPFLSATIGVDGATLTDVANFVMARTAQWTKVGSAIEKIRRGGKKSIDDAASVNDAMAAFNNIKWILGA